MRTTKYILTIILCSIALFACVKEPLTDRREVFDPSQELTFRFKVATSENAVASRSLSYNGFDDNTVKDVNVFMFDETGTLKGFKYIEAFDKVENGFTTFSLLGEVGKYQFAIIANAGASIGEGVNELSDLDNPSVVNSGDKLGSNALMSVLTPLYEINSATYSADKSWVADIPGTNVGNNDPIKLKRRTAKVTVAFDLSQLEQTANLQIQSITLRQVPKKFICLAGGTTGSTSFKPTDAETEIGDGDLINTIDGNLVPSGADNAEKHAAATPLYMWENMQGTRTIDESNKHTWQTYNVIGNTPNTETRYTSPKSMVPDTDTGLCSYVEIVANYSNFYGFGENYAGEEGQVAYKIYLGTGLTGTTWNNFDVHGNTWYKVSVSLKGKGGIDEINWRIDTDIERWGPGQPDASGYNFSYTIHPADALFWLADEYPSPSVFGSDVWMRYTHNLNGYDFSHGNSMLGITEFYEGRYSTYSIYTTGNHASGFGAATFCRNQNYATPPNSSSDVSTIKTYLPSQNELQMINIFHRDATFNDGVYWSSTQLNESALSANNQWARVVDFSLRGQAYTIKNEPSQKGAPPYPSARCLRTPEGSRDITGTDGKQLLTYNGQPWDGKSYPYLLQGATPVIVNREEVSGVARGLKSVSLRTGAPYTQLTPNYHTIRKVYTKFRVAKSDCAANGSPTTTPVYMNWYTAMGYTGEKYGTDADIAPTVPPSNPSGTGYTGCRAYYEDGDRSQIGRWRVPTALELQQIWVMGASSRSNTPARPDISYSTFVANPTVANRLPAIYSYSGFNQMTGNIDAITFITKGTYNSGKNNNTILNDLYWGSTTIFVSGSDTQMHDKGTHAYKQDFYSGDGYSGLATQEGDEGRLVHPDKLHLGKVRCVMDVY